MTEGYSQCGKVSSQKDFGNGLSFNNSGQRIYLGLLLHLMILRSYPSSQSEGKFRSTN